ncbi:MATH domain and coiled-coil domain-containing protein At3g58360-like [Arachis stenosperma]|uniref:MATH domain and coiled-coil domain-containing protein At3g58360-like n=1 Tax=Arachis stenosperma TaxID=217475 RepID=UPI0025AC74F7|nr:MATH domain and coiled-coil domain-containing protein At3g58360-like [Arachis stenosperma]
MDFQDGISRFISNSPPAHYLVKIQFSLLTNNSIERYESGIFEAGGYKWNLILYPSGNKGKNVKDHISLYLALDGTSSSFNPDWEICVNLRFFVLDQNNHNYLVTQDTIKRERRYNKMNIESGFDEFFPLKDFNDRSKGYLVDDICTFGAEVFVCKERNMGKGESLAMIKDVITYKQRWRIDNYSGFASECLESKPFNTGKYKWIMKLYPKGQGSGIGSGYLSLYIALADPTSLLSRSKIYAQITLRILDQKQSNDWFGKGNYWISGSSGEIGYHRFMLLNNFTSQYNGYLVKDSSLLEAEVTILGVVDALF